MKGKKVNPYDKKNYYSFYTHILCTPKGIAWKFTDWKNDEINFFTNWIDIPALKRKFIKLNRYINLKLFQLEKEISHIFHRRTYHFLLSILPHAINYANFELENLPKDQDRKRRKKLKKLKNFIYKSSKLFEKIEKIALNKGYI